MCAKTSKQNSDGIAISNNYAINTANFWVTALASNDRVLATTIVIVSSCSFCF